MTDVVSIVDGSMVAYMARIKKYPLLSVEEELRLATIFKTNGDKDAAWKLITSNLRFVVKIAHEYARHGVKLADLVQEGNLGLMRALQKFDPSKGYRFISYAVWWIRAFIQAFILKTWSLVKIGTTQAQRKLFFSLEKTKREVARLEGKSPDQLEQDGSAGLAGRLNVSGGEIEEMSRRMQGRDVSLDAAVYSDSPDTYMDLTPDGNANFQEDVMRREENSIARKRIKQALGKLSQKERYIVENRLMADEPMSLASIGRAFGVTRERARQLEVRVINKMKTELRELSPAF